MVPMLTVREAASVLHVHENTVRRWSNLGLIRAFRISHRGDRRFRQDEICRFLDELRVHNCNPKEVSIIRSMPEKNELF
jgi:excisionase family DNA binding protein